MVEVVKNLKVLVLEGGFNEEHEISLSTGKEIKKSLSNLGIEYNSLIINPKTFKKDISLFNEKYVCFNALHGTFGEDGKIQKILDQMNIRYTHSSSLSSYTGFNKDLTKKAIEKTIITSPKYLKINSKDLNKKTLQMFLDKMGEYIIKPNSSGSSFGIKIFKNLEDINFFIDNIEKNIKIYENHNILIVEKYLRGRELTVAVIEKDGLSIPVEVTEIVSGNDKYFDYNSKYILGASKHYLPANIEKKLYEKCKNFAKIVHDKINCRGISRSDFILVNKEIFFLEINTQPGLTPISLVPEQLKYKKISFDDLILSILNCI